MSSYSFVCFICKTEQTHGLSERQSAFAARFGMTFRCEACGAYTTMGMYGPLTDMDPSILDQWVSDDALVFLDQDEELILSEFPQSELERAFQVAPTQERKDQVAIAIAIKLYDRIFSSTDERLACKKWLRENQPAWREYWDYEYVIEAVEKRLNLR